MLVHFYVKSLRVLFHTIIVIYICEGVNNILVITLGEMYVFLYLYFDNFITMKNLFNIFSRKSNKVLFSFCNKMRFD